MLHAEELQDAEVGGSCRHCLQCASVYAGVSPFPSLLVSRDASEYSGFLVTCVARPELSALTMCVPFQSVALS